MFENIKEDFKKNEKKFPQIFILILYRISNYIYYLKIHKIIKQILLIPLKIINKIFIEFIFHVEIPCTTRIGSGLRIRHPYGIIINGNTIIGKNCTIFQYVTIGANEHSKYAVETAEIKDNVYIGAGAKIIGKVLIDDNVRIGANAVVVKNVLKNSTVYSSQNIKIND